MNPIIYTITRYSLFSVATLTVSTFFAGTEKFTAQLAAQAAAVAAGEDKAASPAASSKVAASKKGKKKK